MVLFCDWLSKQDYTLPSAAEIIAANGARQSSVHSSLESDIVGICVLTSLMQTPHLRKSRKTKAAQAQRVNHDDTLEIKLNSFPTTRFKGSKRKMLPWIYEKLKDVPFATVLDVFGGTGSVSYLFKMMGKKVIYNDYLRFNYLNAKALIENAEVNLTWEELLSARNSGSKSKFTFVQDHFDGFYFTSKENIWIDETVQMIEGLSGSGKALAFKKAIGYSALFQACLVKRPYNLFHRKNLYMRTARVKRGFGNKTTWDKSFESHFRSFLNEINGKVFDQGVACQALNENALTITSRNADLVYLDPPYVVKGNSETSNYTRSYHFVEGLASYFKWHSKIDLGSRLKYLKDTSSDLFASHKTNKEAFRQLFERFSESIIVISYKRYGAPSISWLQDELKRQGRTVKTHSVHYTYALNHQNGDAQRNREVLIIAEPK